jgi:hypothetical protein
MRDMTSAETGIASVDAFLAALFILIAIAFRPNGGLLSEGGFRFAFEASALAVCAGALCGVAFLAMWRHWRLRWLIQVPMAVFAAFVLLRSGVALGQ